LNKRILNTGIQEFIKNNLATDIMSVLLSKPIFEEVTNKELVEQLESAKKAKDKLPTWFRSEAIIYPKKLHIEQTSSELTASYKSNIVRVNRIADLSGGFGVDSYYFAKNAVSVDSFEINPELSEIVNHNLKALGVSNIHCYNKDGIEQLLHSDQNYDMIYIDPDRRDAQKKRVYFLSDCRPDVPKHLDELFTKAPLVMLKTAPLLDISQGIKDLKGVKQIIALAVKNELKELLWILENDFKGTPLVKAVNLESKQLEFSSLLNSEENTKSIPTPVGTYLYEPNVALLKTGMFKTIAQRFKIGKMHSNTHLYTSDELIEFPGRVFKINEVLHYNKKNLKLFENTKANVSCRNFKLSVEQLKKKHRIKDGGAQYLFFTTDLNNQAVVLVCEKA